MASLTLVFDPMFEAAIFFCGCVVFVTPEVIRHLNGHSVVPSSERYDTRVFFPTDLFRENTTEGIAYYFTL